MFTALVVFKDARTMSQSGFDTWHEAGRTIAKWGFEGQAQEGDLAFTGTSKHNELSQFTVGELMREFPR